MQGRSVGLFLEPVKINSDMNIEEVRDYCLSLPSATERCPFGPDTLAMEIGGRMFCLMTLDNEWDFYNLKADPEYGAELCACYSGIRPGWHMNKRHWISVDFNGDVPDRLQKSLILHSYCQTAKKLPKKVRIGLGINELLETEWKNERKE